MTGWNTHLIIAALHFECLSPEPEPVESAWISGFNPEVVTFTGSDDQRVYNFRIEMEPIWGYYMQRVSINGDGEWKGEGRWDNPEVVILALLHLENFQWGERVGVNMFAIVINLVVATYGSEVYMYGLQWSLLVV